MSSRPDQVNNWWQAAGGKHWSKLGCGSKWSREGDASRGSAGTGTSLQHSAVWPHWDLDSTLVSVSWKGKRLRAMYEGASSVLCLKQGPCDNTKLLVAILILEGTCRDDRVRRDLGEGRASWLIKPGWLFIIHISYFPGIVCMNFLNAVSVFSRLEMFSHTQMLITPCSYGCIIFWSRWRCIQASTGKHKWRDPNLYVEIRPCVPSIQRLVHIKNLNKYIAVSPVPVSCSSVWKMAAQLVVPNQKHL